MIVKNFNQLFENNSIEMIELDLEPDDNYDIEVYTDYNDIKITIIYENKYFKIYLDEKLIYFFTDEYGNINEPKKLLNYDIEKFIIDKLTGKNEIVIEDKLSAFKDIIDIYVEINNSEYSSLNGNFSDFIKKIKIKEFNL